MPNKAFTHKDLSQHLGVSETTVKSYRRKFPGCIPVANQGKPIRFSQEALNVCKRIRDLFELGMSIQEVRARLSSEFPWVSPEPCQPCAENTETVAPEPISERTPQDQADTARGDLPLIVSNLAKSMVNLSQQQAALFKRLEQMENRLESIFSGRPENNTALNSPLSTANIAQAPSDPQLAGKLDGIERTLEHTMDLLGNYVEAVQGLVQATPTAVQAAGAAGAAAKNNAPEISDDYLRYLATLPLVHRNDNDDLVHLGDRSRGAYSLNDLKAVFAQAFMPPHHYNCHWQVDNGQCWFVLEQPEGANGPTMHLLIRLLRTERGTEFAHMVELLIDGNKEFPMTLYPTIQRLLG